MKKFKLVLAVLFLGNTLLVNAQTWGGSTSQTGNTYRTGNVGIGSNTNPTHTLDVTGTIRSTAGMYIGSSYMWSESNKLVLYGARNTGSAALSIHSNRASTNPGGIQMEMYNLGDFLIRNYPTGNTLAQTRLIVKNDGNVGIGTDNPNSKLEVKGNISQSGSFLLGGTGEGYFQLKTTNLTATPSITLNKTSSYFPNKNNDGIDFLSSGGTFRFGKYNQRGAFNQLFTIGFNGKVGIGVDPSTYTSEYNLFVKGGIRTEKIKVDVSTGWADYVFAKDYQLKPLTEVESFIAKNKHLPDVPSACEVETKGIDVAEMDATLLRKIEELTLYVIELQKQINELQQK